MIKQYNLKKSRTAFSKKVATVRQVILDFVLRFQPDTSPPDFDAAFYLSFNDDLAEGTTEASAKRHYARFGRLESRPSNANQFLAPIEAEFGKLPSDFNGAIYQRLNPDVSEKIPNVWRATEHYLRYGRGEGRRYANLDLDLYREFYGLEDFNSDADLRAHIVANKNDKSVLKSGADFMRSRGVAGGGAWLELLKFREFQILNWRWAPTIETKIHAGDLMLTEGRQRMAPLSFDLSFDPAYYSEIHPELAGHDPVVFYDHWLFEGLETGEAGSAKGRLKQLGLNLDTYPSGFDWRAYAHQNKLHKRGRWAALEHLSRDQKPAGVPPHTPNSDGAEFLCALAAAFSSRNDPYCIDLINAARGLGATSASNLQVLADALFRQRRWASASTCYQAVLEDAAANVWTLVNGVRALLEQKKAGVGAELLLKYGKRFTGDIHYRSVVEEAVGALFAERENAARKLYLSKERSKGDAVIASAIADCDSLWMALDPIGAPLSPIAARKRIIILANTDLRQCTHYRVEQKAEILSAMGAEFEIFSSARFDEFMAALPGVAAAIFYRLPALPKVVRAIRAAQKMGVPTYYEIDDMIFGEDYPDRFETYGGAISEEEYAGLLFGVPLFRHAMEMCDYGISSTASLAKPIAGVVKTGKVFLVFNGLDSRNALANRKRGRKLRHDDDVVLFYGSGTKAHNEDFLELAGPAIVQLMGENVNVRLLIVGYLNLDARFDAIRDRITQVGFMPNIEAYWSTLAEADINLAVLRPGPLTNGKSEIKWLEAAALSIPSVVSNTETYNDVLEDGVDAFIACSPQGWLEALRELVADPLRRRAIAEAARKKALASYSLAANAERMESALQPAFVRHDASMERTFKAGGSSRILLTNVFFPPQTIGGATRVVRDNLDYFLSKAKPEAFEFAVATTDAGASLPGRLRVEEYQDVPVFRISTPQQEHMDWRPTNHAVGREFGRVLDIYRPDLVHFHATQRLTASATDECRRRKIPYLITAHDAWWISDFQFLIDDFGLLVDPAEVLDVSTPKGISLGESLQRRRTLVRALKGADAVLSVSDSFAELYERCGVPCTSIPNGVASLQKALSKSPSTGPVRLAHVGGKSNHKGYHLVEAALRQGDFPNIVLTVVEHGRTGGEIRTDMWGSTPIRFVGMTKQEEMGSFYAEQDVLLAPSTWPESFGLVAREALAAGLWVIASDRGAMGEDVQDGINGFVIDVSSPEALFQAFAKLDKNPLEYKDSPPPIPLRSSDEQGAELLKLYADVLATGAAG